MHRFCALAFAALLPAANAAREGHDKFHDPEEGVAAVTVYGEDAIWGQITASSDVNSIKAACSSRLHGGCNRQSCCPCKASVVHRRVQIRKRKILEMHNEIVDKLWTNSPA